MEVPVDAEVRFRELYEAVYVDLLRFVRRRVRTSQAEDVVAEVFLVAWRRFDDVPKDLSAARAWLFGVARLTMQNARRRESKQDAIALRLGDRASLQAAGLSEDEIALRVAIATAWLRLSTAHQEAIELAVLDGLTAPEAGHVLRISPTAFRLRLSRARRSLRQQLEGYPPASADVSVKPTRQGVRSD